MLGLCDRMTSLVKGQLLHIATDIKEQISCLPQVLYHL